MIRLSERSIAPLARIITGDPIPQRGVPMSPYRSGPDIVEFFNEHAAYNDNYADGFGTRLREAQDRIRALNGGPVLASVIEQAVFPAHFLNTGFDADTAVGFLNDYLQFDGLNLKKSGLGYRLVDQSGTVVTLKTSAAPVSVLDHQYVQEQIDKCAQKIVAGDYDGAITNARTLLEAILLDIEFELTLEKPKRDGDLVKYYKRAQKLLSLNPGQIDAKGETLPEPLKMVLSGLTTCVHGIAAARNRMGDAHARSFKPARHHAVFAVNCAKTIADFLLSTFEYQRDHGKI